MRLKRRGVIIVSAALVLAVAGTVACTRVGGHKQVSGIIEQVHVMSSRDDKNPNGPPKVTVTGTTQVIGVIANEAWVLVSGHDGRERRIYRSNGEAHSLEDDLRIRSSVKNSHYLWRSLPDPDSNCSRDRQGRPFLNLVADGQEEIDVRGTRLLTYKLRDGSGGRKAQMWYAPTLGCAMVKTVIEWETPGTSTEIRPTAIKIGPPPAEMFSVDRSYENMNTLERKARRFVKDAKKLKEEDLDPKQREMLAKFRENQKVVDYFKEHRLD